MTHLPKIARFMEKRLAPDRSGHAPDHVWRVYNLAERLLAEEPHADRELVLMTVLLHDTYDDKLFADPVVARAEVVAFLEAFLPAGRVAQILMIIDYMSWSQSLAGDHPFDINGQIVRDADRLDAVGAVAITRTVTYGALHDRCLHDPAITPRILSDKATYRSVERNTTINHFYEKLLLIKDRLATPTARRLAIPRHQAMVDFLANFHQEWQDTKKPSRD